MYFLKKKLSKDGSEINNFFGNNKLRVKTIMFKSEKGKEEERKNFHFRKSVQMKNNSYRDKIRANKITKKIFGISLIFILLIVYIIILIYQMSLITQGDKIFKALFYTYYQKAKLL